MALSHERSMLSTMRGTTVLVAVDGSSASDAAIDTALELASSMAAPVRFVHAASSAAKELYDANSETGPNEQQIVARDRVLAQALKRAGTARIEASVEIIDAPSRTSDLAQVLVGTAEGLGAGVIVCGSRGRSAAAGAIFGSVSHNLVRCATVPVVIVHAAIGDE